MIVSCFLMDVRTATIDREAWNTLVRCLWRESAEREDVALRIQRYHKGCASPATFVPHQHDDTRCFLLGRLMLQVSATAAAAFSDADSAAPMGKEVEEATLSNAGVSGDGEGESCPSLGWWTRALPFEHLAVPKSTTTTTATPLLRRTSRGKPFLTPLLNPGGWSGNVSHAGRVVGMVESFNGALCGIDVMPVELSPWPSRAAAASFMGSCQCRCCIWTAVTVDDVENFFSDLEPYFTPREWNWIRQPLCDLEKSPERVAPVAARHNGVKCGVLPPSPPPPPQYFALRRFYLNWTLKESYIKAVGLGLEMDLQRAEFHMPPNLDSANATFSPPIFSPSDESEQGPLCVADDPVTLAAPNDPANGICLFLDGQAQHQWTFGVWYWGKTESVGAVAVGPSRDGVSPIFRESAPPGIALEDKDGNNHNGDNDDGRVSVKFVQVPADLVMRWYGVGPGSC